MSALKICIRFLQKVGIYGIKGGNSGDSTVNILIALEVFLRRKREKNAFTKYVFFLHFSREGKKIKIHWAGSSSS